MAALQRSVPARTRTPGLGRALGPSIVYLILLLGTTVTLLPFVFAILTSFKTNTEIVRIPPTFWPEKWTFQNYLTIFNDPKVPLLLFFTNSLVVACARVIGTLFTSSLAGFIFAKYKFWGKDLAFGFVLVQLMVPFQIVIIPSYLILVKLGLVNTLWGLIIPSLVDAFGIFLMRQFVESLPAELMDAARIDGATEFDIYWRIVLPQMKAPLAALGTFTFIATWNDYLWPLIVITTHEKRTLPLLLSWYNTQHGLRADLTMAAAVLVMLPMLVVYIFFQRWIVRSVTLTGFK